MSAPARDGGVCADLRPVLAAGGRVLIVYHFPDTFESLKARLDDMRVPWAQYQGDISGLLGKATAEAIVVASTELMPAANPPAQRDATRPVTLFVVGMHPILRGEERVDLFAEHLPFAVTIVRHIAIDEAPMRIFAGELTVSMLKMLGMKDEEAISDPRITAAVRRAQERIEKKQMNDRPARSAGEWMRVNCGGLES